MEQQTEILLDKIVMFLLFCCLALRPDYSTVFGTICAVVNLVALACTGITIAVIVYKRRQNRNA